MTLWRSHHIDSTSSAEHRVGVTRRTGTHTSLSARVTPQITAVVQTLKQLRQSGAEAWIWSGRMDSVRAQTVRWLVANAGFDCAELDPSGVLRMREVDDWTADHVLKQRWLEEMMPDDRARLIGVFDDRDRVVDMYRRRGIACFQVNYGKF
jgi:hypothetical protein